VDEVPHAAVIPPAVKWAAAAWLALWLPLHLAAYPASTLLWWCAYGSILAVLGLCLESRLLVSWQAVALLVPQAAYVAEALARMVTGMRGGGTSYLFDEAVPVHVRTLSLFHFVMPILLVWAVGRLGYDRRALWLQLATGTVVSLVSLATGPINLWYLPAARAHPIAALVLSPLVVWVPAHLLLRRYFDAAARSR
jgi:hypothetical protein